MNNPDLGSCLPALFKCPCCGVTQIVKGDCLLCGGLNSVLGKVPISRVCPSCGATVAGGTFIGTEYGVQLYVGKIKVVQKGSR